MRRTPKAPSASAHRAGSTKVAGRKARGLFGLACLCVLGLAAYLGSSAPSVGAAESFPGQGFLPDNRAWEMVSPPDKRGGDIAAMTQRTRAAADGSAIGFISVSAFADAVGTGAATDYLAQRSSDPDPGDNGWSTHAITPRDDGGTYPALFAQVEPLYMGEFSEDLETGVYFSRTDLTADPFVSKVTNLYRRTDLRSPGAGSYDLLTACPLCDKPDPEPDAPLPPIVPEPNGVFEQALRLRPWLAGASPDFERLAFESRYQLTADTPAQPNPAEPEQIRLFEWDNGTVRLVGRIPVSPATECDDVNGPACVPADFSIGGLGAGANHGPGGVLAPDVVSDGSDGHSRIFFTRPSSPSGLSGDIYLREDAHRTVRISATEKFVPGGSSGVTFLGASDDGSRSFFTTQSNLIDGASGIALTGNVHKLFMYEVTPHSAIQRLTVKATAGQFRLNFDRDGGGPLPVATTADIASSASASTVEAALNALTSVNDGGGSVSVSGGPGDEGGTSPYLIAFSGAPLADRPLPLITTSAGTTPLSGGAATATVGHERTGGHLTLISNDTELGDGRGAAQERGLVGLSADGDYVYFIASGRLSPTTPPSIGSLSQGIYLWHEGTITYISRVLTAPTIQRELYQAGVDYVLNPRQARVTPDGRHLLFSTIDGQGVLSVRGGSDYDHGSCQTFLGTGCRELYVYDAQADTLQCASCNPSGATATAMATNWVRNFGGGSQTSYHETKALSEDGRYAFFSTAERLVSEDRNGVSDAYVYDTVTGKPRLLSSGEDGSDSFFLDASADGSDAFILTRERLSGWDFDNGYDVYDARVGGGFPEPPPAAPGCQGDACQPAPRALDDASPGSSSLQGPGNQRANRARKAKRCPKGRHQVKSRNGKSRCVANKKSKRKAKNKQNKRKANNERRAAR